MEKVKYTRTEYRQEYLQSGEWKTLRDCVMSTKPDCQCCGLIASDVHHMVYRNIVDIRISDLIPVCRKCHNYIHQAIRDGYISQDPTDLETIKDRTLTILEDDEYKKFHKWLGEKHFLSSDEIENIKSLQAFLIKKISGMLKRSIWYDDLVEVKFTGKQILKIRNMIKLALNRRKRKADSPKCTKHGFVLSNTRRENKYKPN